MSDGLITLTTDFGLTSPYVASMKGVILSLNPGAQLIDLSHQIPPHDVRHAAIFLASALPYFPPKTLHVVVVDPGVGTDRAVLYIESDGQRILAPDNGCWTLLRPEQPPDRVIKLTVARFWRIKVSPTFHGRDILAPAAGYLSLGVDPVELGPEVTEWVRLQHTEPVRQGDNLTGEIVFVDHFGNLLSNIRAELLPPRPTRVSVRIGEQEVTRWVRTYGEADKGEVVALISSAGTLEVAQVRGSAARLLGVGVGAPVHVTWSEEG